MRCRGPVPKPKFGIRHATFFRHWELVLRHFSARWRGWERRRRRPWSMHTRWEWCTETSNQQTCWAMCGETSGSRTRGHSDTVYDVAYSPDGTRLASAGSDQCVKGRDAETDLALR